MSVWNDTKRFDGLEIRPTGNDTWMIVPADDRRPLVACPCCDKPFATKRNAMLAADGFYPPASDLMPPALEVGD